MAWAQLREIAVSEGDDAMRMMDYMDITADIRGPRLEVNVEFNKEIIWRGRMAVTSSEVEYDMSDEKLQSTLSVHMKKQLSLVSQMHHARLDKLFPNAIKEVKLGYDPAKAEKLVIVIFKNGHQAEASEAESKTDLFTARCAMLYDLPTR
jgi:hypothetical protein